MLSNARGYDVRIAIKVADLSVFFA